MAQGCSAEVRNGFNQNKWGFNLKPWLLKRAALTDADFHGVAAAIRDGEKRSVPLFAHCVAKPKGGKKTKKNKQRLRVQTASTSSGLMN